MEFYTRDLRLCSEIDAFDWTGSVSGHIRRRTLGFFTRPDFREHETFFLDYVQAQMLFY